VIVDLSTIGLIWPEAILVLLSAWIYLGGTFKTSRRFWTLLAIATYFTAGWVLLREESVLWRDLQQGLLAVNGPLIVDYLGQANRLFSLAVGLLLTLVASRAGTRQLSAERLGTVMMLTAGLMLVGRANDLVFLYVSLELVSIPTYVLLFLGRKDRATEEAATKYFLLSILASALLLFGLTFYYGVAGGTTTIVGTPAVDGIRESLSTLSAKEPATLSWYVWGLVLVLAGLGFKIAAVPFHFYAPDVYQGTTNVNAGLLAIAPKIAGMLALVRLLFVTLPADFSAGWRLTMALAMMTMTLGNVCALWQTNLRRLLAYSSIAHAGYMLVGLSVALAAAPCGGVAGLLFYLAVYVLAALGVFAGLAYLSHERRELSNVSEIAGMGWSRPWVAGAITICVFSLAGIPPLAGFWGKLTLFTGAIRVAMNHDGAVSIWFLVLAIVGVLNAAVAAAYYLRIVGTMYFGGRDHEPLAETGGPGALAGMTVCALLVLVIGLMPGPVLRSTEMSERAILNTPSIRAAPLGSRGDGSRGVAEGHQVSRMGAD